MNRRRTRWTAQPGKGDQRAVPREVGNEELGCWDEGNKEGRKIIEGLEMSRGWITRPKLTAVTDIRGGKLEEVFKADHGNTSSYWKQSGKNKKKEAYREGADTGLRKSVTRPSRKPAGEVHVKRKGKRKLH